MPIQNRAAQDATLINLRALKARVAKLEQQVKKLLKPAAPTRKMGRVQPRW